MGGRVQTLLGRDVTANNTPINIHRNRGNTVFFFSATGTDI